MRLRHIPGAKEALLADADILTADTAPRGRWKEFFAARGVPADTLCLEIGCGRGQFCNDLAKAYPHLAIIGLEVVDEVMLRAQELYQAEKKANLALLWQNAALLQKSFAPGELDRIYLNFSDPWPKNKHAKRRLTHDNLLAVYAGLLKPGGEIRFKTDNRALFEFSADRLLACGWRIDEIDYDYPLEAAAEDKETEYEHRFRSLGQPIHRLVAHFDSRNNKLDNKNSDNGVKNMQFISTRGGVEPVNAAAAIRTGLAADGGLFVPQEMPRFPYSWDELAAMSYQTLAEKVLGLFLTDYDEARLSAIVKAAYGSNFASPKIAPLQHLGGGLNILELWHGPTAAFKDMALQILPHLLTEAVKIEGDTDNEVDILVATSGDTGKAALEGFKNVPGVKIICFYPEGGVSQAQYLQMATTDGDNTYVLALQGNFDNCQTGVKKIFGDKELAGRMAAADKEFSSANSINWGRLNPQIVYYFWSYAELLRQGLLKPGDEFNVAVPTGNFGNILAAYYAKLMGLPIKHLVCASNSNKVLADALASGVYDKRRDFVKTTSPSMDILISSNFERFYYAMSGDDAAAVREAYTALEQTGEFVAGAAAKAHWDEVISGGWADEETVAATIKKYFAEQNYALDPHTAVAVAVYEAYAAASGDETPAVIASTASPFKFGRAVLAALGEDVADGASESAVLQQLANKIGCPVHQGLAGLDSREVLHKDTVTPETMADKVCSILGI